MDSGRSLHGLHLETIEGKPVDLRGRDLVSAGDLNRAEIELLLDRAEALRHEFRASRRHADLPLAGRTVAMIFEKPSLRSRVTFQAGVAQLGGQAVFLDQSIGLGVRESANDVAQNLERWVDAIVVRTFDHSVVVDLAREAFIPVINALSDDEHPCQALADLLTLRERFGRLEGLVVAFVGDGNNVFHSLALAGAMVGMEIRLAHPAGYGPESGILARAQELARVGGGRIVVSRDPSEIVQGADAIYTDVWVSMGQEDEAPARRAAFASYRVDDALLNRASPQAVAMHCLPAHRGEEITAEVLDGPRCLALEQAENRLHAQKAFLVETLADA
jgi:ornithine carbamoyltransferase